jgi:single-strand DNA-binding protein
MSFHTLIFVGNLGKDPEMRYTPGGQPVTSFSVAVSRPFKASDANQKKETIWFRVSVWDKQAEACNTYLKKGSKVLVEGRLVPGDNGSPRTFTRQDGSTGSSYEVRAVTVNFLSSRSDSQEGGSNEDAAEGVSGEEENLPF